MKKFIMLFIGLIVLTIGQPAQAQTFTTSNLNILSPILMASTVSPHATHQTTSKSTWGQLKNVYRGESTTPNRWGQRGVQTQSMSFSLGIPFEPQVPPGDWTYTKNCGQTCAAMINQYFHGISATPTTTYLENWYLGHAFNDSRYYDPNGWYTGFGSRNELGTLLVGYCGLRYSMLTGWGLNDIINVAYNNQPVICGVMISGGRLVASGGKAHWVVLLGSDSYGNVILNDPGTNYGNHIKYSASAFYGSWSTQGRVCAAVYR